VFYPVTSQCVFGYFDDLGWFPITWLSRGASETIQPPPDVSQLPQFAAQTAMPWAFLTGFMLTSAGLLTAL